MRVYTHLPLLFLSISSSKTLTSCSLQIITADRTIHHEAVKHLTAHSGPPFTSISSRAVVGKMLTSWNLNINTGPCWENAIKTSAGRARSAAWTKVKHKGNVSCRDDVWKGKKSKRRQTAKAELLSHYVFPHSVSLLFPPEPRTVSEESHLIIHRASASGISPSFADFGAQPEKIIHHFLSRHPLHTGTGWSIHEREKEGILGQCVYAVRVRGPLTFEGGWSLARIFRIHS